MSDIHVKTGDGAGQWTLVFHFAVPNTTNVVNVNYRTALINAGMVATSSLSSGDGTNGTISSAEETALANGSLYEVSQSVPIDGTGTTTGSRQALIRAIYTTVKDNTITKLQRVLKYFGHTESEED